MNKADVFLLKAFLWGLPLLILLAVFSSSIYNEQLAASASDYIRFSYDVVGYIFLAWLILSMYLGVRLLFFEKFREKVLTKLTFIRERDEREVMLTGRAVKATMLTTIAILLFLFFLSCLQISVDRLPPDQAIPGKSTCISLGFTFRFLKDSPQTISSEVRPNSNIFEYNGLPISSSSVIIGLMLWQIIAYNYSMRRFMK